MKRTQTAFTLMELMVALTLLAIVLVMAAPGYREFTRNNRVAAAHNDLLTALALTRNEAIKRSTPVSVCASLDGATCSGGTDWATGWIVFEDGSGTVGQLDGDEDELLQVWPGLNPDMVLAGTQAFIRYAPNGTVLPEGARTFDVYADGCTGDRARRIAVLAAGMVTPTKQTCP